MDINELIGPEPIPVPAPKFPTPWHAWGNGIYPKSGAAIAIVGGLRDLDHEEAAGIARFIVEAVNEKVANDAAKAVLSEFIESNPVDATEYFKSPGNDNSVYRIRKGSNYADSFYVREHPRMLEDHLSAAFVRNYKLPVSREDVPEAFRL